MRRKPSRNESTATGLAPLDAPTAAHIDPRRVKDLQTQFRQARNGLHWPSVMSHGIHGLLWVLSIGAMLGLYLLLTRFF